ncbi:hypothetical protein D3C72_2292410 [compost metagenome]
MIGEKVGEGVLRHVPHPADIGKAGDRPFPGAKAYGGESTDLILTGMTDQRHGAAPLSASLNHAAG